MIKVTMKNEIPSAKLVRWVNKAKDIFAGEVQIMIRNARSEAKELRTLHLRIDGRDGRWRVDQHDLAMWVACDFGGFDNLDAAVLYAERFVLRCSEQHTCSPKNTYEEALRCRSQFGSAQ